MSASAQFFDNVGHRFPPQLRVAQYDNRKAITAREYVKSSHWFQRIGTNSAALAYPQRSNPDG
jgi:hypothetical protein